jgi:hypothetical protein
VVGNGEEEGMESVEVRGVESEKPRKGKEYKEEV